MKSIRSQYFQPVNFLHIMDFYICPPLLRIVHGWLEIINVITNMMESTLEKIIAHSVAIAAMIGKTLVEMMRTIATMETPGR